MQKPDYLLPYIGGNNKMVLPIWKYTGAKYSWWMQQDEGRGLYKTKFEKWLISQASDVISNSVVGMDFMEDAYGLNKDKMVHYNNVINVPDAEGLKPYWKSHLGIKEDVIVVSMIANITPFKDHKTLFKAWRSVENHFKLQQKDVFLLLAGRPEDKVLQELKILGFDLHISNSICFLGGTKRTNELINESDLVVHSSLTEGCPNAVCEAMALQKAVVGTNIPGNAEALTDTYKDFCLSNPKDANDLSEKIIYLLENPKLRSEIGIFNKERIIEHYNSNQMLEKLSKCFAKV